MKSKIMERREKKKSKSINFQGKNDGIHLQNVTTIIANQEEPTQFMHSFFGLNASQRSNRSLANTQMLCAFLVWKKKLQNKKPTHKHISPLMLWRMAIPRNKRKDKAKRMGQDENMFFACTNVMNQFAQAGSNNSIRLI